MSLPSRFAVRRTTTSCSAALTHRMAYEKDESGSCESERISEVKGEILCENERGVSEVMC